ncbi:Histone protein Lsr2 [Amycolatopsis camponoti]|uniref:Histone protein Lsr2 n=1 Tax=Amycolatopsis camponoti TaxID=2606593 RepID=A0A6I8M1I0_9PSEU|nr:Lsr2 family protein [Amycolatopsis camponoti]VVJ22737.1 Histone protein Lsr2 [Amycolatopsis camponoti]
MAQKVKVELLDDIDGTPATQAVKFALDGVEYEIDLSDDNATALREELARYVEAARRTGGRKRTKATAPPSAAADRERSTAIRTWAKENGHNVSDRGRLSTEIIEAYEQATTAPPVPAPTRTRRPRKKVAASKR